MNTTKPTQQPTPGVIASILGSVERTLLKSSALDQTQVRLIATEITRNIVSDIGGCEYYIPKNINVQTNERYNALWDDFTGNNHHALAVKYGMSITWVYQCIARIRDSKK